MKHRFVAALAAFITVGTLATASSYAGPLDSAFRGFGASTSQAGIAARSALPPLGYQIYCLRNKAECRSKGAAVVPYTAKLASDLQRVNRSVNRSIRFKSDRGDVWQASVTEGDCEDYVLTKRKKLIRMGVSANALRVASVRNSRGERHAVLVVRTSKGELVLDNARSQILPRNKTGYRWVAMSSENPHRWSRL